MTCSPKLSATAGRAATDPQRSAARANLRLQLQGDQLSVTGTDVELTIHVEVTVAGDTDGVLVLPARLTTDIVRSLEPGAVDVDGRGRRGPHHLRPLAVHGAARCRAGGLPAPRPDQRRRRRACRARRSATRVRQVVGAASRRGDRPVLTGVLLTAEEEGLRLVATDSYRLAVRDLPGTSVLREGQKVLVPSRALSELVRVAAVVERGHGAASASARRRSTSARCG